MQRASLVAVLLASTLLASPLLVGCGASEPTAAAPSAPVAPTPALTPPAGEPALGEAWAKVPLADGAIASANAASEVPAAFRNGAGAVACPVMGMAIDKAEDAVSYADHEHVRYYFCCDSCEKLFLDNPGTYANGAYLKSHDLDPTAPAACEDAKIEG
ncbi:MAG: YHS domain-containing protein [Pseudomonadota bacterium]|nr:YHS domain-containing protein [Pseudomonadota bacterium]